MTHGMTSRSSTPRGKKEKRRVLGTRTFRGSCRKQCRSAARAPGAHVKLINGHPCNREQCGGREVLETDQ